VLPNSGKTAQTINAGQRCDANLRKNPASFSLPGFAHLFDSLLRRFL
jgi:hypothetical protein